MEATNLSLLDRARNGAGGAWDRLYDLYQPLIFAWLRRHSLSHHIAEELTQDVLLVVLRELNGFRHSGRTGAFRNWLRLITANRARAFWKANRLKTEGNGDLPSLFDQMEDESSELSRVWDREHDEHVLRRLLESVAPEFTPATLEAFRLQALEGLGAEETATRTGLSVGAAYVAKSRVLRRLREEAGELIG